MRGAELAFSPIISFHSTAVFLFLDAAIEAQGGQVLLKITKLVGITMSYLPPKECQSIPNIVYY